MTKIKLKSTFTLVLKSMFTSYEITSHAWRHGSYGKNQRVILPSPHPPKSHTRPQCKSYILLPCYKMYEVGTDREKQRTKGGEEERAKDVVTYTARF